MSTNFRAITEAGDTRADADQLAMARLRHSLVEVLARDRDLLDVACGTGYALPLIARTARSVTACDRDAANVRAASARSPSAKIFEHDAEHLPLPPQSYDVVSCLEAIYYFRDWRAFLGEAHRLLRDSGTLVISWPDPGRPDFDRSPGSTYYPSAEDMTETARAGFDGVVYGGFALVDLVTGRRPWLDVVRRMAVHLHLIPRSLRWRMMLKRLVYRRMRPLAQLTLHPDPFAELVELGPGTSTGVAMLYFVGTKSRRTSR